MFYHRKKTEIYWLKVPPQIHIIIKSILYLIVSESTRVYWYLSDCIGICLIVLVSIWLYWYLFDCIGIYLIVLVSVWLFWYLTDCIWCSPCLVSAWLSIMPTDLVFTILIRGHPPPTSFLFSSSSGKNWGNRCLLSKPLLRHVHCWMIVFLQPTLLYSY